MTDIDNRIKVVAQEVIERPLAELRHGMKEGFKAITESIEDRDRKLLDDLTHRIRPLVVEFKDRAVAEAELSTKEMFRRLFNVSLDDNQEVKDLQKVFSFAELMHKSSRWILVLFVLCVGLAFSIASGKGMTFLQEYGPMFLGR